MSDLFDTNKHPALASFQAAGLQQQGLLDAMRGQQTGCQFGQPGLLSSLLGQPSVYLGRIGINTIDTMQSEVDDWLRDWDK